MTIRRTPTHLLQLFEVFFRGKELLTRELFLEWSEGFDAVRLGKRWRSARCEGFFAIACEPSL